ncbi:MDR family MFS transporter [Actinokineospora globicatena]|uniref:MDR family MFS transporter n=1 Tax=Actinokineospora globicatena TaxID=103729 RepID=UPI0020A5572C|nr:MFS transporter [Actinokineospora globicatena]MCP2305892.1 Major Facilitator Superfamily protein [Actinokineospora globicatena]GLW80239.1 putative MFS-type transporter YqjV [Actinokineospora globicatena]GLW87068.1 putative MFS-type transporter YqjV [Actinokineospora globicatena]
MNQSDHPSVVQTLRQISRPVWLLLVGMLVNRLGNFLQIFLVLYLTQKGFSETEAGVALGAYGIGSVVGVLLGGTIADRFGYRWTIVVSMAGAGALTAVLVHLSAFWLVLVVAAATGLLAQAYRPASSAMLVELTPEKQHVMVFAVYRLAFNLGTTAGPLLGALLIAYSYDLMFYVDAVTSVVFALFALRLPHAVASAKDEGEEGQRKSYLAVLSDRGFTLFMLALFLNAVVYIQHIAVLPLQITADGHGPGVYAALLSLNAIVVIALELPFTKFVQRLPAKVAVALGVGLVGVGMNLYIAGPAIAMFVVATLVWTLGEIIGTPTASAYPGQVAPPGLRGRYIAAAAFPMQIGYAIGPALGVALWTVWPSGVWWGSSIITVVAVLAAVVGMRQPVSSEDTVVAPSPGADVPLDEAHAGPRDSS